MNKEIKPTYVSFEQAKWLKEKGFYIITESRFFFNSELTTKTQSQSSKPTIYAPEQWQVVEWLRINHNIDLQPICNYSKLGRTYRMGIIFINKENKVDTVFLRPIDTPSEFIEFNTPQEAYSKAFDYIIDKNLKRIKLWKQ
jgi:hypothetical protein